MLSLAGATDTGSTSQPRNLLEFSFSKILELSTPLTWSSLTAMAEDWQSSGNFHRQHDWVHAALQRSHCKSQKETVPYQQDIWQEVGWQHERHASCMPLAGNAYSDQRIQCLGSFNTSWHSRQITAYGQPYGTHHH